MPSSIGPGILGGAMSGAGTGMSIAGPWGAAAGAAIGGIAGFFSGQENNRAAGRAQSAANAIPLVDPAVQAHLMRVKQLESTQRAGTDQTSAYSTANVNNVLGQTQANIRGLSGSNPVLGLSGMLGAQRQADNAIQGIGANAGARADASLNTQYGIIGDMERRKRDLQEFKRNQAYSELIAGKQNINNMVSAGLGLMPGLNLDKLPNFRDASNRGVQWDPSMIGTGYNREARTGYRNGPEMDVLSPIPQQPFQPSPLPPMTPAY